MINLNCKLSQCRQLAKLKVLGNMTIIEVKVKQRTWGGKGRGQGGRVGNAGWSSESTEAIAEQLSPHQSQNSLLKNHVPYY